MALGGISTTLEGSDWLQMRRRCAVRHSMRCVVGRTLAPLAARAARATRRPGLRLHRAAVDGSPIRLEVSHAPAAGLALRPITVRPDGGARAAAHGPTHDIFRALLPFFSCSRSYLPIIVLHIDGSMRRSGVAAVKLLFPAHTRWRRRVRSVEAHSRLKRVRERAHFFMFLNDVGIASGSSVLKAAPSSKLRAVESWGLGGPKKLASPWLDRPRNPAIRAVLERA